MSRPRSPLAPDPMDPADRAFMTVLLACFALVPVVVLLPGCSDSSPPKPTLAQAATAKPIVTTALDQPEVASVVATHRRISVALDGIRERLVTARKTADDKALADADLAKVIDLLRPLAATARADVDAVIGLAEDIQFETQFVQRQYTSNAQLFRDKAAQNKLSEFRAVNADTAVWFDALAADVPRRQELTARLLEELKVVRSETTEARRTLDDFKARLEAGLAGGDPLPRAPRATVFRRQVENFLEVLGRYTRAFFKTPGGADYLNPGGQT